MALTIKEVFNIQKGILRPDTMTQLEMVEIQSKTHADWFLQNGKEVDEGSLAFAYKSKMTNLAIRIKSNDYTAINAIAENQVLNWKAFMAYTDIKSWTGAQWEEQIALTIVQAFERTANILPSEKTAYEAL